MKRTLPKVMAKRMALPLLLLCLQYSYGIGKTITLNIPDANSKIKLKNYNISEVIDDRPDKSRIGYITTAYNTFRSVDFRQSLQEELMGFISNNVDQNPYLTGLTLHVFDYFLFEKASFKGGEIAIKVHFALYNRQGDRILDYDTVETKPTALNMRGFANKLLRNSFMNYLHNMDQEVGPVLAAYAANSPVKVSCSYVKHSERKGFVSYLERATLDSSCFAGRPSQESDMPFWLKCGLDVNYKISFVNDTVCVTIQLLPYFNREMSWLHQNNMDLKNDIAYINTYYQIPVFIAIKLASEIRTRQFTFANLKREMNGLTYKYMLEMHEMQQQFLTETSYNKDKKALADWEGKLHKYW